MIEPLQVERYYDPRRVESMSCIKRGIVDCSRYCTILTVLEKPCFHWLAGGSASEAEVCLLNRLSALKKCAPLEPGRDGVLLVSCEGRGTAIQQGDAVAFYNYFTDASCDWDALLHAAGLPAVSSTKWIGNHFYHRHVPFLVLLQ
jgi:hypothetical protein